MQPDPLLAGMRHRSVQLLSLSPVVVSLPRTVARSGGRPPASASALGASCDTVVIARCSMPWSGRSAIGSSMGHWCITVIAG